MTKFNLFLLLLFQSTILFGQSKAIQTTSYYPKDAAEFTKKTLHSYEALGEYEPARFGKTTLIILTESDFGNFYFVFKKKNKDNDDPIDRDLHAFIFTEDHGGILEKARFQDYGNAIYWPEFDYKNCFVDDTNRDGVPEFYLSYLGESDGLDAKPYKQIIYHFPTTAGKGEIIKAKATAYYPAGNEEDVYTVVFDAKWKEMPQELKDRSRKVLDNHKKQYIDKFF